MIELNESNYTENVSQGLVLLDFYTNFCGPCKMLAPVLEKIENIKIFKIDASSNPNLTSEHNISSVPTLIYMRNGVILEKTIGYMSQEQIQAKVNKFNE